MAKGTLKISGADSFTAADLAPDSVGTSEIAALAVDTAELAADAVDGTKIADNAVDSEHIAADSLDAEHYAPGSVDGTAIADNAVTLDKMAGGTDGQILTYDASGDPVAVGPGTDGQVLTSTGAGSPPAFQFESAVPTGMIAPMGMSNAPTGWLACDGSAVSRTTYSVLFGVVSTTWGTGNGSSTFNVPDLRGAFLRGTGTAGVSNDYVGANVGAYQDDQNASHNHSASNASHGHSASSSGTVASGGNHRHADHTGYGGGIWGNGAASGNNTQDNYTDYAGSHSHTVSVSTSIGGTTSSTTIGNSGSTEARVYNRGVQYCIKY